MESVIKKRDKSSFFVSNLMFMLLAIVFIASSFLMSYLDVEFKKTIVIIQYIIILVPIFLVMKFTNVNIKKAFRFNKISVLTVFKIFLITLACIPAAYSLNLIVNMFLMKFSLFRDVSLDLGSGFLNFLIIFFLVSITPGICEEIFFRGMMLSGFESKLKPVQAIVLSGFLFAIFHFTIQNFMLPIFLGIVLAIVVRVTNSIFSSMFLHGFFNAFGVLLMYFGPASKTNNKKLDIQESIDLFVNMKIEVFITTVIALLAITALFIGLVYGLLMWLKKEYKKIEVGDYILIDSHKLEVINIEEDYYLIKEEEDIKKVKKEFFENNNYKIKKKNIANIGDLILINKEEYIIEEIKEDIFILKNDQGELKRVKSKILRDNPKLLVKYKSEKNKVSIFNYVFICVVLILYIVVNVIAYT